MTASVTSLFSCDGVLGDAVGVTVANGVLVITSSTEEDAMDDPTSVGVDNDVVAVDDMIIEDVIANAVDEVGAGARLDSGELVAGADAEEIEEASEDFEDSEDADETDGNDDGTALDGWSNPRLVTRVVGTTNVDEATAIDEIIEFDIGVAEFTDVIGAVGSSGNA